MSKVTYILGAGASYGLRAENGEPRFKRGVPVISEFSEALDFLIHDIDNQILKSNEHNKTDYIDSLNAIKERLIELKEICDEYPTRDTYAKLLYVTKKTQYHKHIDTYERLKDALSVFLLLFQLRVPRDPRYDGFIASIIHENGTFPPLTILSWNYDAQFEMAYSGYVLNRYIPFIWNRLNVVNKTYDLPTHKEPFSFVKLNGTAFFKSNKEVESPEEGINNPIAQIIDVFYGGHKDQHVYDLLFNLFEDDTYTNTLSYAWENDKVEKVIEYTKERCADTEELIVIGYSFPYVNRDMDKAILLSMHNLKRIYIQDPKHTDIIENIKAILGETKSQNIDFVKVENMNQYKLPATF